jgi:hypothetical protein
LWPRPRNALQQFSDDMTVENTSHYLHFRHKLVIKNVISTYLILDFCNEFFGHW